MSTATELGRSWRLTRPTGHGSWHTPLVIGHRGSSARAPENSVEAFRRAGVDGADGVELDVLACATGEIVVFHDDDLRRLAGRHERIADLPLSDIRDIALLSGARIPTLAEALAACGVELLVNIELKSSRVFDAAVPALVERVSETVDHAGAAARVLVSSFNPLAVRAWSRWRPDVKAALLFERAGLAAAWKPWTLPWLHPFAAHPHESLCQARAIDHWHRAGYAVNTWTVDDPVRLRALRDAGIDGIVTNDPGAARAALESR